MGLFLFIGVPRKRPKFKDLGRSCGVAGGFRKGSPRNQYVGILASLERLPGNVPGRFPGVARGSMGGPQESPEVSMYTLERCLGVPGSFWAVLCRLWEALEGPCGVPKPLCHVY